MNPGVIQFQCSTCQSPLTVPLHLAGVTGPCPKCGATITSPKAPAAEALPAMPLPGSPQPASQPPPQPAAAPQPAPSWGAVNPLAQYTTEQPAPPPIAPQHQPAVAHPPPAASQPVPHGSLLENITGVRSGPLQNRPAPAAPASHPPAAAPCNPGSGTLLPPRRSAGQAPAASLPASGGSLMNQPSVGGSFPPPMPNAGGPLGGPPAMSSEDPMSAILQGRQPSAPLPARQPSGQLNPASGSAPSGFKSSPPVNITLGSGKKKSGRWLGSVFLLLIVSGLVAAGWHFREPIRDLAYRFFPGQFGGSSQAAGDAAATASTEPPASQPSQAAEPTPQNSTASTPPPAASAFDPAAKNPGSPGTESVAASGAQASQAPPASPEKTAAAGSTILGFTTPGGSIPAIAPNAQPAEPPADSTPPETVKPAGSPLQSVVPKAMVVGDAGSEPGIGITAKAAPGSTEPDSLLEVPKGLPVPPQPAEPSASPRLHSSEPVVAASPEAEKAVQALKAFFNAKTVEERAKLVLGGAQLKQRMESYYQITGEGALDVSEIKLRRFDPSPQNGGGAHCVFNVASRHWPYPFPIMLQEQDGEFKVDWLAFAEFKDDLLFKFLSEFQEMPARFHVSIRRTHYFQDDVPNRADLDCFEIQPPMPTFSGYVFVPKDSQLAASLKKTIGWETLAGFAVVELKWKRLGDYKWVEMTALPQLNWYSAPAEPLPAPPPAAPPPADTDPKKATADATARK